MILIMNQTISTPLTLQKSLHTAKLLQKKQEKLQQILNKWQQKLRQHQNIRLLIGLAFLISLFVLSMMPMARAEYAIPAALLVVFLILVVRTRRIHGYVQRLNRWTEFLQRQQNRALGRPSGRTWKQAEDISTKYPLIRDLGLLGPHSLWTLLDETLSEGGQHHMLHWMSIDPQSISLLKKRQQAIKDLRSQTWFYTRLVIETDTRELNLSTLQIQDFLKTSFVSASFNRLLVANLVTWFCAVALFAYAKLFDASISVWIFLAFPVLSLWSLGNLGSVFLQGTGLSHHLSALTPVLGAIEKKTLVHAKLREQFPAIYRFSPSRMAKKLESIMGFVGTQTNPILHFILNALVPWTVTSIYFLERLRTRMASDFPACLNELSEFEVLGSILILDRYQTQTYPEFTEGSSLACQQIFHPLLDRTKAIANDFSFLPEKSLGLLTGSNMSGKSTFLRTMGMNQLLANMGAPVFADSFKTTPLKIETCIEVSDSLRDGYSYFYAEVRRLKHILNQAAQRKPLLFLIDEIFRGTNNRERQIGSRAVIQTLAHEKSAIGFISTHDLELTSLEEKSPSLTNLHFREDIDENGKMIFHYLLRTGPCPTTNALRIMAAEGIKVDETGHN